MILAILITLLSTFLLEQVLFFNGGIKNYPHILYSTLPVTFLIGPVIYHYVRENSGTGQGWQWKYLIHLAPFFYELIVLAPFYFLPAEIKIRIYEYSVQASKTLRFDQYSFGYMLYVLSTLYFLIMSFKMLRNLNPQKRREQGKRKLLIYMVQALFFYLVINMILFIIAFFEPKYSSTLQQFSPLLLVILIHILGFICYLNPEMIEENANSIKYVNSGLSDQEVKRLGQSLVSLLEEKRLYLNQELKPEELARELGISTSKLSQVISEGLNSNFYNLVNEKRVKKAKGLMATDQYSDAKLLHIALDSGFSNKSSFVRNFKRFTGMNPSDYRRKRLHSNEWNAGD